ncbi:uncharacterized protein LOC102800523 [Saccoglossus kowalevskii]|uniref:Uncharacterized protein LOC102800523 n=1 Tax=Saccoglossus kowalevskii TaxID=10224 RepID=A0ABM0MP57_SACKO|nr:PREDICTED: uncharacterized protein LOC102800523 [Saccoglossus kowalevskii]
MKVCVVLLLFAVISAAVAEDVGKEGKKTRIDKPVDRPSPRMSSEHKSDLVNRRKEHLKTLPAGKSSAQLVSEKKQLMRNEKEKIAEIKASRLSPEEKSLKLESLRNEYRREITALSKEAKTAARLEDGRRRTFQQEKARRSGKRSNPAHP